MFGHDLAYSVPEPLHGLAFGQSSINHSKLTSAQNHFILFFPILLTVYSFIWDVFSVFLCIYVLGMFGPLMTEPVVGHIKILPWYYPNIFVLNDSSHYAHTGKINVIFLD